MREWAFLMIRYETPAAVKKIQDSIDKDIVYHDPDGSDNYGIEKDSHVTIAPCLDNDVNLDELKKILKPLVKYKAYLTDISSFSCEDYDVLKCNVVSQPLVDTNKKILDKFESHSEYKNSYHPHLTIAYLKKGHAEPFCKKLKQFNEIKPTEFLFSFVENDEEKETAFEK